ncbi:YfhO family protein, partial [Candidatus Roizmanbacteria bacterium]|nr:YfhO family protein [Candidatus Roizmanbacteria bacterium]
QNFYYVVTSLIIGIGITAIQWLPTFEFVKLSIRGNGLPYELASWGSLPLSGLKLFLDPSNYGELAKFPYGFGGYVLPNFFEYFSGWTVILIPFTFIIIKFSTTAVYYCSRLCKKPRTHNFQVETSRFARRIKSLSVNSDFWFFWAMVFIFLWLSFGNQVKFNLHFIFYNFISFYRNIRIPAQHLIMVVFILPIMFGLIIDKIKNKWLQLAILLIVVMELFPYSKKFYLLADLPEKKYDENLIKILPHSPEEPRLLPNFNVVSPVLDSFDFNAVLKFHIPTTSGYDPMILRPYYEFIERLNKSNQSMIPYYNVEIPPVDTKSAMLDWLNIGYVLTEPIAPPLDTAKYQILIQNEKYTLYKNKNPNSRFYFSSRNDNSICPDVAKSEVKLSKYSGNEIIISSQTNCDGILSSGEVYYPGWKATIDGKETSILKSNYAFRAISLPKGMHTVRFFYSPDIYILGGIISLASLIVFILFLNFYRLKPVEYQKV